MASFVYIYVSFAYLSQQRVRPYLVFVTTQLVKRLTRYSALLDMNVGGNKLPFSEVPSFLTSHILG